MAIGIIVNSIYHCSYRKILLGCCLAWLCQLFSLRSDLQILTWILFKTNFITCIWCLKLPMCNWYIFIAIHLLGLDSLSKLQQSKESFALMHFQAISSHTFTTNFSLSFLSDKLTHSSESPNWTGSLDFLVVIIFLALLIVGGWFVYNCFTDGCCLSCYYSFHNYLDFLKGEFSNSTSSWSFHPLLQLRYD